MNRKLLAVFLLGALVVGFTAPPARAFTLGGGTYEADLSDASTTWVNDVPRAPLAYGETFDDDGDPWAPTTVALGDELRVVFNIDGIQTTDGDPVFNGLGSSFGTLSGLIYDLVLVDIVPLTGDIFELYFAALARNPLSALPSDSPSGSGGVIEIWEDSSPIGTPVSNLYNPGGDGLAPQKWVEAGYIGGAENHASAPDAYPTVNNMTGYTDNSTLWLQGVLVPIAQRSIGGKLTDILWIETIFMGANLRFGTVSSAVIDIVGGSAAPIFVKDGVSVGSATGDVLLSANLRLPGNDQYENTSRDAGNWAVASFDPANFGIIPEPTTVSLLVIGLVGLVGRVIKRRRAS